MQEKPCVHCQRLFKVGRNPQQQFCGNTACQNVRKHLWRKKKYKQDPDYRDNQNRANQVWRRKNPLYWRDYREAHPDYTQRNRQQQRLYKQKLSVLRTPKGDASQFAKSDALTQKNHIISGTYKLIPEANPEFAKSDALTVKIAVVTEGYTTFSANSSVCK
jgi:hypothetical protein